MTSSYPRGLRKDPLIAVVTNQPPGGSWAPRGRLEAFVPPTKELAPYTVRQVNQSLGEFPTYVAARDAILAWWAPAGQFPKGLTPTIQYNSSKCSDFWKIGMGYKNENLRDYWEYLPLEASSPRGPQHPPGYWEAKFDKKARSWWGRLRGYDFHIDSERFEIPPDADGYWPPRGPSTQP